MFRRGRNAAPTQVTLPEEPKALAERYTIDADEAQARAVRAAEEQAHEADDQARREAEEHARFETEAQARGEAEQLEQAAPAQNGANPDAAADLPIYAWLRKVVPAAPDGSDWTRELVRPKETRGDDSRGA